MTGVRRSHPLKGRKMPKAPQQVNRDGLTTHSADCYQWHHDCAIAEVERLREKVKTWAELEQQYQAGCTHCTHPMYCGIRCNVCGRWTEKP